MTLVCVCVCVCNDKLTEGEEIKCTMTNLLDVLTAKHLGDQSTNFALYAYL